LSRKVVLIGEVSADTFDNNGRIETAMQEMAMRFGVEKTNGRKSIPAVKLLGHLSRKTRVP
jgi:hypothetical protein